MSTMWRIIMKILMTVSRLTKKTSNKLTRINIYWNIKKIYRLSERRDVANVISLDDWHVKIFTKPDTSGCTADGKQYKTNHNFNCDSKRVVYLLTYKVCWKQYVGHTTDKFCLRWSNYKVCQRKAVATSTGLKDIWNVNSYAD